MCVKIKDKIRKIIVCNSYRTVQSTIWNIFSDSYKTSIKYMNMNLKTLKTKGFFFSQRKHCRFFNDSLEN